MSGASAGKSSFHKPTGGHGQRKHCDPQPAALLGVLAYAPRSDFACFHLYGFKPAQVSSPEATHSFGFPVIVVQWTFRQRKNFFFDTLKRMDWINRKT